MQRVHFKENPRPFNAWAKEFFPGVNYLPNKGTIFTINNYLSIFFLEAHYFFKILQDKGKLSKFYTQNIDGLERLSGIEEEKLVEAHGTFSTAACIKCRQKYNIEQLKEDILDDKDPACKSCGGWIKPNIVFFGEALPKRFFDEAELDCEFCDQLICLGTSLEVYPFAGIFDQSMKL